MDMKLNTDCEVMVMIDKVAHVLFVGVCSLIYGLIMTLLKCREMKFSEKVQAFLFYTATLVVIYVVIHLLHH